MTVTQIRTFNARRGRLRPGRLEVLARLSSAFALRDHDRPDVLEIGSGMGEAALALALADPASLYTAVEVHTAGVANLLRLVEAAGLRNVRVVQGDALVLLRERIPSLSLSRVNVFFPDPWPKARHHKRRLIQPSHVELLADRLRVGGALHCATDSPDYAQAMLAALSPTLRGGIVERPPHRPVTRYERRALDAGRPVWDLVFLR